MNKKLTHGEFVKRFAERCGSKLNLLSLYENKRTPVLVECKVCGYQYSISADSILYKKTELHPCYNCTNPVVKCDFCGNEFRKRKKEIDRTKHSYCSIICRNRALNDIKRKSTINNYRAIAMGNYMHKCAVCGWDEDVDILEVHHIDENRGNNKVENLMLLCPTCHRKLTLHKYKLENNILIKI